MEATIFFFILATIAIMSAFITITRKHPLSATLSLVITLIALAGLYALLSADFLFIIQILVYAGAIMALMIFVIMLLNLKEEQFPTENNITQKVLLTLLGLSPFFLLLQSVLVKSQSKPFSPLGETSAGTIQNVGLTLYKSYFFPFEVVSILLLVALVGVVALAKRRA